mgnify:CR=1 FL=1
MSYITVFTPTYNRGYILDALYKSLCGQTFKDFEWLIVDDGSTDDTALIVKKWKAEKLININYVFQKNGGKHTAHNLATQLACGELFVICDSDDHFTSTALQAISSKWEEYRKNQSIAGLIGYRGETEKKRLNGKNFPYAEGAYHLNEIFELGGNGLFDTTQIYRTSIMRQFKFPEYENEKFIPEYFCWKSIDLAGYKVGVLPQILEVCEYREDGLTKNANGIASVYKNPCGFADYALVMSKDKHGIEKYKWIGKYIFLRSLAKKKIEFSVKSILALPFSIAYWGQYLISYEK